MIKINNLTYKYDKVILDNINLEIDEKKITFIIGTNGSGKSTLANLISGLIFTKDGNILIDDLEINKKTNNKLIRQKIGMVLQNPNNQLLFTNVYDDIKFTLENINYKKEEIDSRIKDSLKKVNMESYINSNPYTMSGGEIQKIAIASQLSINQNYLILDEATRNIDIKGKKDIYKLIKNLKKDMGIIFITNDMNELIYADDIIIINNNKVFKYTLLDIINDNNILKNNNLEIPFILKIINTLKIKDLKNINEEYILKVIRD